MRIIYTIAFAVCLTSCSEEKVVDKQEVFSFLKDLSINNKHGGLDTEIAFWSAKLDSDTGNFVYASELAGLHLAVFHLNGDIKSLHRADSLMVRSAEALNFTDPEMLQALSQLSITRHDFSKAFALNEQAKKSAASPFIYSLIRFDTDMELGRYGDAEKRLNTIADKNSFHYLIRKAKQQDHLGDLEGAIKLMETAFENVEASGDPGLYSWTLSNLGDMYGHAGRVQDAYDAYVSVLQKDPGYLYALKGIAWIAYSHDNNAELARTITEFIMKHNSSPDHFLFLAELADYEGKQGLKDQLQASFIDQVSQTQYGNMYNKYLIELFSDDLARIDEALMIAEKEVHARPTPETFSWLAWVHFKKGHLAEAANLFQNHVSGKTGEPEPLLKGYYMLSKSGKNKEANALRSSSVDAAFELGPVAIREINDQND